MHTSPRMGSTRPATRRRPSRCRSSAAPFICRTPRVGNEPSLGTISHHALTGYGTDYIGEAEIGIWELRAGCNTPFLWFINSMAVLLGVFLSPTRLLRAWRSAAGARSLYLDDRDLETLLAMPLGELRAQCGVPREGIAANPAGRTALARMRADDI